MTVITKLDALEAAVADHKLLERACLDCIEALIRHAVVGYSFHDGIRRLEELRQQLEKVNER